MAITISQLDEKKHSDQNNDSGPSRGCGPGDVRLALAALDSCSRSSILCGQCECLSRWARHWHQLLEFGPKLALIIIDKCYLVWSGGGR